MGEKSRTEKQGLELVPAAQSRLTLCSPVDRTPPGSSARGLSQARMREWRWSLASGTSCVGRPVLYQLHCLGSPAFGGDTKVGAVFFPASFIPKASRENAFSSQWAKGKLTETLMRTPCAHVDLRELRNFISFFFFFTLEKPSEVFHYLLHMDAYYNP